MYESAFRKWFGCLKKLRRRRVEWPQLLRFLMEEEFAQIREYGEAYKGDVFKDRDKHALRHENHLKQHREDVLVQRLFRDVHNRALGVLEVGSDPIWLISFQVPNQASGRGRRADLLGLRPDGSLVVFECKVAMGKETPLYALTEGLDYLAHLTIPANMKKLRMGFDKWRNKRCVDPELSQISQKFSKVEIDIMPKARHAVFVLAPEEYYKKHHRLDANDVPQMWDMLSDRAWPETALSVGLDFAITDFRSGPCSLLAL